MLIGREQRYHPDHPLAVRLYIALLGAPVLGLRIRARNVAGLIPPGRKFRRILDAGSGPGVISFLLGRIFPDADVLGIDRDRSSVEASRHIAARSRADNVRFRQMAVEDLEPDGRFDLVVCVDILEHIADDEKALQALSRALIPGGVLVLHVPALYRRYPVWKKARNFDVPTHARDGYAPEDIVRMVERSGLRIVETGFTYGFWETLANNISYGITRARMENPHLYALAFPLLHLISLIGCGARPRKLGAGIFVVAETVSGETV